MSIHGHTFVPFARRAGGAAVFPGPVRLPVKAGAPMVPAMFVVTDAEAAAIRAIYEQSGEFSAAVELRRLFPSTDTAQARACARAIAGWKPLPVPLCPVPRGRARRRDTPLIAALPTKAW